MREGLHFSKVEDLILWLKDSKFDLDLYLTIELDSPNPDYVAFINETIPMAQEVFIWCGKLKLVNYWELVEAIEKFWK